MKKHVCTQYKCQKLFDKPYLLRQHIQAHNDERNFICDYPGCNKRFLKKSHLKVHRWTHSPEKPLSCLVCSKGFTTNQQLSRHMKTHEAPKKCPYLCSQRFSSKQDLEEHMLDRHFLCEVLETPSVTDSDEYPFDFDPTDLHCQVPMCSDHAPYDTFYDLLCHYDNYHDYVPESLYGGFWDHVTTDVVSID